MKSTVLAFNKKINELKEHLLFDKKVQRDIADLLQKQEHVPESLKKMLRQPEKKIFDYKLSILILYGSFENFVENIIYSYLDKLNCNIERFIDLPKDIIDSHQRFRF
jgi:F0F1-type ATP synthase alpha subunit